MVDTLVMKVIRSNCGLTLDRDKLAPQLKHEQICSIIERFKMKKIDFHLRPLAIIF